MSTSSSSSSHFSPEEKGVLRRIFGRKSSSSSGSSVSSSPSELTHCVQKLRGVAKAEASVERAEQAGADAMLKWALNSDNSAIKDVAFQTTELFSLHGTKQSQFRADVQRCSMELSKIGDLCLGEEKELERLEEARGRLAKLKKNVDRARNSTWKKGGDIRLLEEKISVVKRECELRQREVERARAENEILKMSIFRQTIQELSEAYVGLSSCSREVFSCLGQIGRLIPTEQGQGDLDNWRYTGTQTSRRLVDDTRRRLGGTATTPFNNAPVTPPATPPQPCQQTPPPPYSASVAPLYPKLPTAPPLTPLRVLVD